MTLNISKKLILCFLGLTLVVLIATLGLARWSFERGFLVYVNIQEQMRMEPLVNTLSQFYSESGDSWSLLTQERFNTFRSGRGIGSELEFYSSDTERQGPAFGGQLPYDGRPLGPPRPGGPGQGPPQGFGPPDRNMSPVDSRLGENSNLAPQSGEGADFFPADGNGELSPRLDEFGGKGPDIVLVDNDGGYIAGEAYVIEHPNPITAAVIVQGRQVAQLITGNRESLNAEETAFSQQQMLTSGVIGVVSLALAAVVAWVLTGVLLAPIRRLTAGVSLLSGGHYSARLNESSRDELGQLMNDLDHLAHKLEESRASRRRWIADISHELRTPLTVLTGEIELLKDGIRPFNRDQLLSLDQEIERLRHLIEDLYQLSVSDIGGLRYSFAPLNVLDSISVSIENIRVRASERGVDLVLKGDTDYLIKADSQRLTQLLNNLIENSLAYTNAPGKIEINVFDDAGNVYIKLEDTPPGVAEKDCEKLFEPLYREEASRNRRSAGAGLGLAICKNIVSAHQGTISASPSKLGGLCITISLPILAEV